MRASTSRRVDTLGSNQYLIAVLYLKHAVRLRCSRSHYLIHNSLALAVSSYPHHITRR